MKEFKQPKILLPISLHDAKLESVVCDNKSGGINRGNIIINLKDGFLVSGENGQIQTSEGSVFYDGVDFDFCQIYAFKEEDRKGISFTQLSRILKHTEVEISDVTFGYDLTKIYCYAYPPDDYYVIEIEIYHEKEAVYKWA